MKTLTFLFSLFLLSSTFLTAQSTERFIRIIGNSKKDFAASGVVTSITIAEQQPNEYKQIKYRPFEMVYGEYITELSKLGIPESQLVRNQKNITKYTQTTLKEYTSFV